jgi:glucose uptake protein GlcU
VIVSGILFGSQFVPRQRCRDFPDGAYNVSMALGILAGSLVALLVLGPSPIAPAMAAVAFAGGVTWVIGNYLLIFAVAHAGMARSFIVINFSAVLSFAGGMVFLGELPDLGGARLACAVGAVALVMLGSYLVVTTAPRGGTGGPGSTARRGLLAAFVATAFFSAYNVLAAYVTNGGGTGEGIAFAAVAPGIVCGAALVALLGGGRSALRDWRAAPLRSHLLAALQGLIWATAMVCIFTGWRGAGIALGTAVQGGTQTLVSALWGIMLFGEFAGLTDRRRAYVRLASGAAATIAGIAVLTSL